MDRARRVGGLLWLAAGLIFQLLWLLRLSVVPGPVTLTVCAVIVVLGVAVLVQDGRLRWACWVLGWIASAVLGLDFLGAVADRFGLFGPPGAPGVSWGGWAAFLDYTARLLPGLGRGVVVAAAVAATAAEVALGALLLSGWQRRWVAKAAAGLLLVYLVAMGHALGADAVAAYAVPILIGGALLVSTCPSRRPVPPPGRTEALDPLTRKTAVRL